ncbi:recombinase family protein [Croceibacterium sp. TMG7-5b_MA50]|uniref:recombinase family protein n=1 Tax=Croceibacterium sp. TMG7-5b_MA50 TaxID=3121290 RepID=UPI0032221ADE
MGGPVPLGYRVVERKLIIDEAEAATVRHIFTRYAVLGSGRALIEELRADGYRTRQRTARDRTVGGVPFQRGSLFALLTNPIYAGQIACKDEVHAGEHQAIVAPALWQAVQQQIAAKRVARHSSNNVRSTSLLAGVLFDPLDRRMTPSHTRKGSKRYRYYVTHASQLREGEPAAYRLPATDIEDAVAHSLGDWLTNARRVRQALATTDATEIAGAIAAATRGAEMMQTSYGRRAVIEGLVDRVRLDDDAIRVSLHRQALAARLEVAISEDADLQLVSAAAKMCQGTATKLVLAEASNRSCIVDDKLVRLLAEARAAQRMVATASEQSIEQIAAASQQCRKRFARLLRLAWLAPSIVADICEGRHPPTLTPRVLLETNLPLSWDSQRAALRFA